MCQSKAPICGDWPEPEMKHRVCIWHKETTPLSHPSASAQWSTFHEQIPLDPHLILWLPLTQTFTDALIVAMTFMNMLLPLSVFLLSACLLFLWSHV